MGGDFRKVDVLPFLGSFFFKVSVLLDSGFVTDTKHSDTIWARLAPKYFAILLFLLLYSAQIQDKMDAQSIRKKRRHKFIQGKDKIKKTALNTHACSLEKKSKIVEHFNILFSTHSDKKFVKIGSNHLNKYSKVTQSMFLQCGSASSVAPFWRQNQTA